MDKGHTVFGGMEGVRNSSALNSLDGGGDGMGDVVVGGSGGMASGGVSVTSDDVVAGNITQSEIVIDSAKAGRTRKRVENLGLKVTLGVLMLAIVGLGVGVGMEMNRGINEDRVYSIDMVGAEADVVKQEILSRLANNENYTLYDAVAEFERELTRGDDSWKVSIAIPYAWFLFGQYDSIEMAIAVMERVGSMAEGDMLTVYYGALSNLYDAAGMESEADYYQDLVIKNTKFVGVIKAGDV